MRREARGQATKDGVKGHTLGRREEKAGRTRTREIKRWMKEEEGSSD